MLPLRRLDSMCSHRYEIEIYRPSSILNIVDLTQEYAPLGDLTSNVSDVGIGETPTKRVAKQIASALDYIHSKYV